MKRGRKPSGCGAAIWFHPGVHEQTQQSRSDDSAKQRAFVNEKRQETKRLRSDGSAKQRAFVNEKRQETKRLRSDGSYEYPRAFPPIVGRRQIRS